MPAAEVIARLGELAENRLASAPRAFARLKPLPVGQNPGYSWAPNPSDPEEVEIVRGTIGALADLLRTEAFVKLCALGGEGVPDRLLTNPLLGFTPPGNPEYRKPVPGLPGYEAHECDLTGAAFALPIGAPVPALLFEARTASHELEHGASLVVHPRIYAEGAEAVYRALWAMVMREINRMVDALARHIDFAAAAGFLEVGDFEAEPSSAFYDFKERAGRVKEEERHTGFYTGWKDLPRAA